MAEQFVSPYRMALADRQRRLDASVLSGVHEPFVCPWDSLVANLLFLAVLFIPRLPQTYRRVMSLIAVFAIYYMCISTMNRARSLNFAGGYGIGLSCVYAMIMAPSLLLFNDIDRDYIRIEKRSFSQQTSEEPTKEANGAAATSIDNVKNQQQSLHNRKVWGVDGPASEQPDENDRKAAVPRYVLVWQGFPESLGHRFDWTLDLITSFRGVAWNWRIPTLPPIDAPIQERETKAGMVSKPISTTITQQTLHSLHRQAYRDFFVHYLILDFLKTVLTTDPYFLGYATLSAPTPWHWLSSLNTTIPFATKLVRLLLTLSGVLSALTFIFSLCALFFTIILPSLPLPPSIHPYHLTKCPVLEPSLYPPYWHPLVTILDQGLPGFWGKYWHQLFRHAISAPSVYLNTRILHLPPKSQLARILQVTIAFALTAAIHAGASYTTTSPHPSNPLRPFLFFLLQAPAVLAQKQFARSFSANISDTKSWPRWLRRTLNGVFVAAWLYATGPLLSDDFAVSGVWLFEPVPVSLLRGLGFGPGGVGEGWWVWGLDGVGGRWVSWWTGRNGRWWRSGIAVF